MLQSLKLFMVINKENVRQAPDCVHSQLSKTVRGLKLLILNALEKCKNDIPTVPTCVPSYYIFFQPRNVPILRYQYLPTFSLTRVYPSLQCCGSGSVRIRNYTKNSVRLFKNQLFKIKINVAVLI